MRLPLVLVGVLAAPSLVACAVSTPDPTPDPNGSATAVVEVDRTSGASDSSHNDAVAARVVRVKQGAVDESALRIAGVAEDVPAPGTCIVPADASAQIQGRSVELLDIGQVTLTNDEGAAGGLKSTVLTPRYVPDPAGVVSGVLYSYASRSTDAFLAGGKVALRSSGGADLDGFTVNVNAPHELADLRTGFTNEGLDVAWDATDSDLKDVVFVDLLSPSPHVALRCVAVDAAGHLVVSGAAVAAMDEGQLNVHRVHKESFRAKGIEPGEVRFDVAKVITFRR